MEQIAPLLEKLAQQLGTTAQYLWAVLIKQAQVEAAFSLAMAALGVVPLVLCAFSIWVFIKSDDDDGDKRALSGFAVVALFLIGATIVISNGYNYMIAHYNPEYWALNEILKRLQ